MPYLANNTPCKSQIRRSIGILDEAVRWEKIILITCNWEDDVRIMYVPRRLDMPTQRQLDR